MKSSSRATVLSSRFVISRTFHGRDAGRFACPKWQGWMREKQPRLLVIDEKYEVSFDPSEPEAYRRDVPTAAVRIVDGRHFALDTAADQIALIVRDFIMK